MYLILVKMSPGNLREIIPADLLDTLYITVLICVLQVTGCFIVCGCVQMLAVLLTSIHLASMSLHVETSLANVRAQMLMRPTVDRLSPRCVSSGLEPGDMTAAVRKRR